MITMTCFLPSSAIIQSFDRNLLNSKVSKKTEYEKWKFDKIYDRYLKKIDDKQTGKKKEFEILKLQWFELYERAKIKEEIYERALENAKEMPRISATEGTLRFKRFQSEKIF